MGQTLLTLSGGGSNSAHCSGKAVQTPPTFQEVCETPPNFSGSKSNSAHCWEKAGQTPPTFHEIDKLPTPAFLALGVREAGVGTYDDLVCVKIDTPLIECFRRLVSRRLSALPVLDDGDVVVDIYARFDAIAVAAESAYDTLDRPVLEALNRRKKSK
uniref:CBS domain-containing protein n=1 Tax=Romanomermis culicivorax TaxID=13658 RepID=A0A915L6J6_ROMCU